MVPGEGILELRDAEEPFALESPTTITGSQDDESGAITGATFSTPTVEFDLPVESIPGVTAHIEATISEVSPGTSTGSVDPEGNVSLSTSVTVDLRIEAVGLVGECQATPVSLDLLSVTPYDEATETVTLRDPDFSIPQVPVTPECQEVFADGANDALQGSGHSVTLPVEGALTVPEACETDSTTTLEVTPADGAGLGEPVEMTATVTSDDPEVTEPIAGVVEFYDGTEKIGEVAATAGEATFTTTTLGLGSHDLTARYRGDSLYCSSESPAAEYAISANPVFEVAVPGSVRIGAAPVEFPLTLENPAVGSPISNARLDVTFEREGDPLQPPDVLLEREGTGGVWEPVTLSAVTGSSLTGTIGPAGGRPLAPGASLTENLRISFPTGSPATIPGPLTVTFDAIDTSAAPEDALLSSTSGPMVIRNATRAATQTTLPPSAPPYTRVGGTLVVDVQTTASGTTFTYAPTGPVRLLIDGVPVPFWASVLPPDAAPQLQVPFGTQTSLMNTFVNIPPTVGIGEHTLTAQFLGDDLFAPSSISQTFTVYEPIGTPYECVYPDPFSGARFVVHASAEGRVPTSAAAGAPVSVEDFDLSVKVGRSLAEYFNVFIVINGGAFEGVDIDLGENGAGSAVSATQTGDPWFGPDAGPIDWDLTFDGEVGSITPPTTPGEVITTAIEGFTLVADNGGFPLLIDCNALGEPIELGDTVVAGTTLSVEAPTPTRSDDEVILRAAVSPDAAAGVVDFYDGSDLIGIAAIDDGEASITTTLPEGTRSLTARSRTGASAPSTTSEPVEVQVLPAFDCGAFAEAGSGAVVRLVYLELLGRCPDQVGYDHWVGQLGQGVSSEVFARRISDSTEARGLIVDDAYETMLERAPDGVGRAFWAERLRSEPNYGRLLADLAASGEFWALSGSTRVGFVTRVYDRLLDRAPEPAGLEFWTDRLAAGTSRRALVTTLANQDEPLGRLVAAAYDEILSRAPFSSEQSNGSTYLRGTGNRSGLYAQLIGRPEFATRAQSFPNPED